MTWVLLVLLAAEPNEAAKEPRPVERLDVEPIAHGPLNTIGLGSSTVVLLAASTGAALASGVAIHGAPFAVNGRPNVWVTNVGILVMLGVQFAVAHLLVPTVATWWRPEHDVVRVREKAWEWSRWPLAAGALGAVTSTVGALLEETRWGRGDGVMAAGLIVTVLSLIVFDVFEGIGALGALR